MKSTLLLSLILLCTTFTIKSQDLPQPSPSATVTQTIGLTDFSIEYSRPGVKGRKIWGDLVAFGDVWRTGANKANQFTVSTDFKIGGKSVPAGTYSLFTIPNKEKWTIILNSETELWGSGKYDMAKDVARFDVTPQVAPHKERMAFSFENITNTGADIELRWEKVLVSFKVEVNSSESALANINKAIKEVQDAAKNWRPYANAANYAVTANVMLDDAKVWIDAALEIEDYWWSRKIKSEVMAATGNYTAAIENAEIAIKLGKEKYEKEGREFTYAKDLNENIAKWKKQL